MRFRTDRLTWSGSVASGFAVLPAQARDIGGAIFGKAADMQDVERVISAAEAVSGDRAKAGEWLSQPEKRRTKFGQGISACAFFLQPYF